MPLGGGRRFTPNSIRNQNSRFLSHETNSSTSSSRFSIFSLFSFFLSFFFFFEPFYRLCIPQVKFFYFLHREIFLCLKSFFTLSLLLLDASSIFLQMIIHISLYFALFNSFFVSDFLHQTNHSDSLHPRALVEHRSRTFKILQIIFEYFYLSRINNEISSTVEISEYKRTDSHLDFLSGVVSCEQVKKKKRKGKRKRKKGKRNRLVAWGRRRSEDHEPAHMERP